MKLKSKLIPILAFTLSLTVNLFGSELFNNWTPVFQGVDYQSIEKSSPDGLVRIHVTRIDTTDPSVSFLVQALLDGGAHQVDSIYLADPHIYEDTTAFRKVARESLTETLSGLWQAGIDHPQDWYSAKVLQPIFEGRAKTEPEDTLFLIETLRDLPLGGGAFFGASGKSRQLLDKYQDIAHGVLDHDPAEDYKKEYNTSSFKIKNSLHKFIQETPNASAEEMGKFKEEVMAEVMKSPIAPSLAAFVDTEFKHLRLEEDQQAKAEIKERLADLTLNSQFDEADAFITQMHEEGKLSSESAFVLKQIQDGRNIERRLKSTKQYNELTENIKMDRDDLLFSDIGYVDYEMITSVKADLKEDFAAADAMINKLALSVYSDAWRASELPAETFKLSEQDREYLDRVIKEESQKIFPALKEKAIKVYQIRKQAEEELYNSTHDSDESWYSKLKKFFQGDDKARGL